MIWRLGRGIEGGARGGAWSTDVIPATTANAISSECEQREADQVHQLPTGNLSEPGEHWKLEAKASR